MTIALCQLRFAQGLNALINLSGASIRSLVTDGVRVLLLSKLIIAAHSYAAEDTQLLSITGDLIDVLQSLNEDTEPLIVIDRYYGELTSEEQLEAAELKQDLIRLIPNYEIAFAAADTAEMNSVLSEVAYRWAVLRTFHAEHFTDPARDALYRAYVEQYLLLN